MKYTRLKEIVLLTLIVLGLYPFTLSQADDKLTVFVDNNYPPYMYQSEDAQPDGLYPRLLKEIVKQTQDKVEIKAYPWKRALIYSAIGQGAVGGAYKNDERLKVYDYSDPLYQENLVLFINKDRQFKFTKTDDIKDKVIGVNRGWSYGEVFDTARENNLFKVSIRNDPVENFKMLALGRIDCLILDKNSGDAYVEFLNIKEKIISLPRPFSNNNGYLIIPKALKKDKFLLEFNAALKAIKEDGTYNKIVQTFIKEVAKPNFIH